MNVDTQNISLKTFTLLAETLSKLPYQNVTQIMQNLVKFEGFTVSRFPGNAEFHSRETGMGLFPGFPGTGTGMDALVDFHDIDMQLYPIYSSILHFINLIIQCIRRKASNTSI